jgi:hypothetical protein
MLALCHKFNTFLLIEIENGKTLLLCYCCEEVRREEVGKNIGKQPIDIYLAGVILL